MAYIKAVKGGDLVSEEIRNGRCEVCGEICVIEDAGSGLCDFCASEKENREAGNMENVPLLLPAPQSTS